MKTNLSKTVVFLLTIILLTVVVLGYVRHKDCVHDYKLYEGICIREAVVEYLRYDKDTGFSRMRFIDDPVHGNREYPMDLAIGLFPPEEVGTIKITYYMAKKDTWGNVIENYIVNAVGMENVQ